jgi:hypothetical protein
MSVVKLLSRIVVPVIFIENVAELDNEETNRQRAS